ncbi:hypothetical protein EVAR_4406_1 [Eumeta japonica]|uniref:Uncharacterized protein n=1 Tax=Eumeta variegata TaxID=151549 RepID=A0A4C1SYG4_EUMVA|nr:hypothetical protein EVAR_4406_1 [Eumeta japonica]
MKTASERMAITAALHASGGSRILAQVIATQIDGEARVRTCRPQLRPIAPIEARPPFRFHSAEKHLPAHAADRPRPPHATLRSS